MEPLSFFSSIKQSIQDNLIGYISSGIISAIIGYILGFLRFPIFLFKYFSSENRLSRYESKNKLKSIKSFNRKYKNKEGLYEPIKPKSNK